MCEARYQIQEEACKSLKEAWDRGEEPPQQTLAGLLGPASWPYTGSVKTEP